jgi:VIT1/CCC1 family predicted Fe2+/Mn2+ transporter
MSEAATDPALLEHYLEEEVDAAFLYRQLADLESEPKRKDLFLRLAAVEDRHILAWEALITEAGRPIPPKSPSSRTRLMAWLARKLGPHVILPRILAEEGREAASFLRLAAKTEDPSMRTTAAMIARESAEHAGELGHLLGREGEPWHTTGAGGYMRSIVYGFNDGLTANFGLVAGVIGAGISTKHVILTGIAGAVADALSMGSSGYLAAKSEAEVHENDIALEREEIRLMPDLEIEELALIYEAKGVPADQARAMAESLMSDPERALETKVREELHINKPDVTPLGDGMITGTATAIGAIIPIVPFLMMPAEIAIWISLTISMLAHFGVGAARSIFTGRGLWISGRDMFFVGFGVALAGYIIGRMFEGWI